MKLGKNTSTHLEKNTSTLIVPNTERESHQILSEEEVVKFKNTDMVIWIRGIFNAITIKYGG
jgi:hypothetical protein